MKIIQVTLIGVGGTMTMDLWALLLKAFGIQSLNFAYLGRWILSISQGKWFHSGIADSPSIQGELYIGWFAHYTIGVLFCWLLVSFYGLKWVEKPSLKPALIIGLITVFAPLMILQPALGLGYFALKSPDHLFFILKSFVTHTVYGLGLYLSAIVLKKVSDLAKF